MLLGVIVTSASEYEYLEWQKMPETSISMLLTDFNCDLASVAHEQSVLEHNRVIPREVPRDFHVIFT